MTEAVDPAEQLYGEDRLTALLAGAIGQHPTEVLGGVDDSLSLDESAALGAGGYVPSL